MENFNEDSSRKNKPVKVVIVGDTYVGKSSILNSLLTDESEFVATKPTIGAFHQFYEYSNDDDNIILDIWDTAGQESFRSIIRIFYSISVRIRTTFKLN